MWTFYHPLGPQPTLRRAPLKEPHLTIRPASADRSEGGGGRRVGGTPTGRGRAVGMYTAQQGAQSTTPSPAVAAAESQKIANVKFLI